MLVCQRMTSDNSGFPHPPLPLNKTPQKRPAFSDKGERYDQNCVLQENGKIICPQDL